MKKKRPRWKPVRLNDSAAEALATDLLAGQRPTPPRVRALLQELDRRRKEPVMEPKDDVTKALIESLDPDDAAEAAAIAARTKEYAEHDQRVREKLLARPASTLKRGRIASLNEAAEILLRELDLGHADRVREIARENGWEPWVVILGQVVRAADLNELAAGEFSPEWLNRDGRETAVSSKEICLMCGHAIPGARKGQSACCSRHGSGKVEHNDDCPLTHVVMFKGQWVDDRRVEVRPA